MIDVGVWRAMPLRARAMGQPRTWDIFYKFKKNGEYSVYDQLPAPRTISQAESAGTTSSRKRALISLGEMGVL